VTDTRHTTSAFPHLAESCQRVNETEYTPGLTKRELFAAMAMQGMVTALSEVNPHTGIIRNRPQDVAELSALYADTLIAELAKDPLPETEMTK
jgi:hypothetical protein